MLLSFHLLTNDHFQGDFSNKRCILFTFSNISLHFHGVHLMEGRPWATLLNHKQLFNVNQNLLPRVLKIQFYHLLFFFLSLHRTTKEFLAFMKATVHVFVISITCALFSVDWPKSVSKSFKNTILPSSVFFPLSASNN